jgi:hypothetical protein
MKFVYLACLIGLLTLCAQAAHAQQISAPLVRPAVAPRVSVSSDTRSLMAFAPIQIWREGQPVRVKGDLRGGENIGQQGNPAAKRDDPLLAQIESFRLGAVASPVPQLPPLLGVNVDGIGATGVLPPDSIGAVGANHYIQMVNSAFAIYSKTGQLLAGPSQINSLWRGYGGPCESDNDGDPVVRYDHLGDRWMVSQFAIDEHMQCVAISRGPDPVNSGWYLYAFETKDANGIPVTPDYPKLGVWPDGYYMSTQRGFPSAGMDVWVFERDKMLQGLPARQIQFAIAAPSIVLQPSDFDGPPPPAGSPNFFVRQVDGERFGGTDRLEIFAFATDWSNPANSTFTSVATLNTAPFDSVLCIATLGGPCVPQPGTPVRLHTLSVWPMFRAQYRRFEGYETLMLNHSVDATGQDQAGIRWYELRRAPGGPWVIKQQGTHAPDTTNRWMGSIAMDAAGDIVVAYSVGNELIPPGLRAAIWRPGDPPGTMGPEATIIDGRGAQTHPASRWGDYGSMDVDPVQPCVFWFTSLYYATTSSAGWSTRIAEIRPADRAPNCNPVMPNLSGLTMQQARERLRGLGLTMGPIRMRAPQQGAAASAQDVVVQQSVPAGTELVPNATVDLTLLRVRRR